jgi:sugar (pentulose or hexulose) kinase
MKAPIAAVVQALADITGVPLRLSRQAENATLGCAILMAAAGGGMPLAAAVRTMVVHDDVRPDEQRYHTCSSLYAKWREMHSQLDSIRL